MKDIVLSTKAEEQMVSDLIESYAQMKDSQKISNEYKGNTNSYLQMSNNPMPPIQQPVPEWSEKFDSDELEEIIREVISGRWDSVHIHDYVRKTIQQEKERVVKDIIEKIKRSRTHEESFGIGIREDTARSQVIIDIMLSDNHTEQ
jgi:hypothetical protein